MAIEINLTRGKVALVDEEDFDLVNRFKWKAIKSRKTFYAGTQIWWRGIQATLLMHRLIASKDCRLHIDHVDGDGLNNTRSNLRECTNSQNHMNIQKLPSRYSIFKGVTMSYGRWTAQIFMKGRHLHLGTFETERMAATAYDKAAKKYFGEFARLNFPSI